MNYSYRQSGMAGCEILDQDGNIIAWTVDSTIAEVIVHLLNG